MLFKKAVPADAVQGCFLHERVEDCEQGPVLTILISGMDFANAMRIHRGITTSPALLPYVVSEKPVLDLNECLELNDVTDLGQAQPDDGFRGPSLEKDSAKLVLMLDSHGSDVAYRAMLKEAADAVALSGYRLKLQPIEMPCTGEAMADAMFRFLEGHYEKKRITMKDGTTEQITLRRLFDRTVVLCGSPEAVSRDLAVLSENGENSFILGIPSGGTMKIPEHVKIVIFDDDSCGKKERLLAAGFSRLFPEARAVVYCTDRCASPQEAAIRSIAENLGVPFFQVGKDWGSLLMDRRLKKALHVK